MKYKSHLRENEIEVVAGGKSQTILESCCGGPGSCRQLLLRQHQNLETSLDLSNNKGGGKQPTEHCGQLGRQQTDAGGNSWVRKRHEAALYRDKLPFTKHSEGEIYIETQKQS